MHISRTVIFLAALMACMVTQPISAQSKAVGKVAILKGSGSRYTPDGSAQALRRGDKVYEGDRVVTGRKSLLSILFDDKTRFNLGTFALKSAKTPRHLIYWRMESAGKSLAIKTSSG